MLSTTVCYLLLRIKRAYQYLRSFLPTKLPTGMTEFAVWSERIIVKTGALAEVESMKFVLATELMRLENESKKLESRIIQWFDTSDRHFVKTLKLAATKQIGAAVFQDIRTAQQQRQDEKNTTTPDASVQVPDATPTQTQQ